MDFRALPERPPSEVEWEELLVKLEVAPRAIRVAVEDAADTPRLREVVVRAALAEAWWGNRLEDLREGRSFSLDVGFGPGAIDGSPPTTGQALEELSRQRGRNFAKLQRRGLEVWEWRAQLVEGHPLTTWQFLHLRLWADAEVIRAIRALPGG